MEQTDLPKEVAENLDLWLIGSTDPWIHTWKNTRAPRLFGPIGDSTRFLNHPSIKEHCKKDSSLKGIYNALKTWPTYKAFFGVFDRWDGHKIYSYHDIRNEVRRYTPEQLKKLSAKKTKLPASTTQAIRNLGLHKDQELVKRK